MKRVTTLRVTTAPQTWIFIFILALSVRWPIAALSPGAPPDMSSYKLVGDSLLQGNFNPYTLPGRPYPYPPLWMFVEAASVWLSQVTGLPMAFIIKMPSLLADASISVLILRYLRRRQSPQAMKWALLYAANPISLLVIAAHGQFDALPLLFILLALYFGQSLTASGLFMGLSVLLKAWPVLLVPAFLADYDDYKSRFRYACYTILPTATSMIPYLITTPNQVYQKVFAYSSTPDFGYLGLIRSASYILSGTYTIPSQVEILGKLALLSAVGVWWLTRRARLSSEKLALGIFLIFYLASSGIGAHYLLWIIPIACILQDVRLSGYLLVSFLALVFWYAVFFPSVLGVESIMMKSYSYRLAASVLYTLFNALWWSYVGFWLLRLVQETRKVSGSGLITSEDSF